MVLCVFTLHCCRGRGSLEQKQQRQAWHAALADRLPAGDKAAWGPLPWVDPRIESHSTADRFGFEWSPKGNHPTLESWAEAVRDDYLKFMHKSLIADRLVGGTGASRPGAETGHRVPHGHCWDGSGETAAASELGPTAGVA